MVDTLRDADWRRILRRIDEGRFTPFLGAGANCGILPLGGTLAKELADIFECPFEDCSDLIRVSQYVAVTQDGPTAKEEVQALLEERLGLWEKEVELPDFFRALNSPLGVLARLPIPIYITTNYDDLMTRALEANGKTPNRELCRWNSLIEGVTSVFDSEDGFEPTPDNPVVFHLHGYNGEVDSLVLTEDDYFQLLISISRNADLIPPRIQEAIAGTTLIFVGYRLMDWDFRVIFRSITSSVESAVERVSLSVQLPPEDMERWSSEEHQRYLADYYGKNAVKVFWGTAEEFTAQLQERWEAFKQSGS